MRSSFGQKKHLDAGVTGHTVRAPDDLRCSDIKQAEIVLEHKIISNLHSTFVFCFHGTVKFHIFKILFNE